MFTRGHKISLLALMGFSFISLLVLLSLNLLQIWSGQWRYAIAGFSRGDLEESQDANDSNEYLIRTPGCVIQNFPVDHPSIARFKVKAPVKVKCGTREPLTEESGLKLRFYPDRLQQYGLNETNVQCFYQGIVRVDQSPNHYNGNSDRGRKIKKKNIPITADVTSIGEEDAILVRCHNRSDTKGQAIYKNIHYFIQPKRFENKKKRHIKNLEKGQYMGIHTQLNVLIVGNDAVSRTNLLRHLPKTYDYLMTELEAIDLRGFNKIEDNTFPNLITIFTGLSLTADANHSCVSFKYSSQKMDDCPFIWKNYSQKGYVTVFAEDAPWMGTFRFARTGFVEQPTDFYNSPYAFASDDQIGHSGGWRKMNGFICQGGKLTTAVVYDYSLMIAKALKDIPYFGYFWIAALTHDELSLSSAADLPSLEYLKKMNEGGYLENTVLFFISDHGMRWGDIRMTYAGKLEERLPYVLVVLPKWFKEHFPEAVKNLRTNSRRLTSNYDLYATLHDLHNQAYFDLSKSYFGPKYGQSLFFEVPLNRTCADVAISDHFCTCRNMTEVDIDEPYVWEAANHTVQELNKGLRGFKDCVQLTLHKIISARVDRQTDSKETTAAKTPFAKYLIIFTTKPGDGVLESTVQYQDGIYKVLSEVSRINAYLRQSHCVQDFLYRKYCYCKDLLV